MKHRSRLEIIAEILETANTSKALQAKIMHRVYLSYPQLKEYLALLLENNLIEYIQTDRIYRTTTRGMHFLEIYQQLNDVVVMTDNIIVR
ncbi:MAG: winged helix-turn-helix domain-containing protein [Candidatus Nitrosopolaris sp.]